MRLGGGAELVGFQGIGLGVGAGTPDGGVVGAERRPGPRVATLIDLGAQPGADPLGLRHVGGRLAQVQPLARDRIHPA